MNAELWREFASLPGNSRRCNWRCLYGLASYANFRCHIQKLLDLGDERNSKPDAKLQGLVKQGLVQNKRHFNQKAT